MYGPEGVGKATMVRGGPGGRHSRRRARCTERGCVAARLCLRAGVRRGDGGPRKAAQPIADHRRRGLAPSDRPPATSHPRPRHSGVRAGPFRAGGHHRAPRISGSAATCTGADRSRAVDPAPDARTHTELLRVLLSAVPLASDVDLPAIGERTPGFVAADLVALRREAAVGGELPLGVRRGVLNACPLQSPPRTGGVPAVFRCW